MVTQGNTAPDFTLDTDKGAMVTLSELRGRQVVPFFCPKAHPSPRRDQSSSFRDAAGWSR